MCPTASRPPRPVCHFVRPHKDATKSCVAAEGWGIVCLMDIPEIKASTLPQSVFVSFLSVLLVALHTKPWTVNYYYFFLI